MLGLLPWEVEALLAAMECEEMDIGEQPTMLLPVAVPVSPVAQPITRVLPIVRFHRMVEAINKRRRQFIAPYQLRLGEKDLVR